MKLEEIESNLWAMANNLRGNMDASEYKNYIFAFMFYRFLSLKEEKYLIDQKLVHLNKNEEFIDAFSRTVNEEVSAVIGTRKVDDKEREKIENEVWDEYKEDISSGLGYAIKPKYMWHTIIKKISEQTITASYYSDAFNDFNNSTNTNSVMDFKGIFSDVNLGDSKLGSDTAERAKAVSKIVSLVADTEYIGENGEDVRGQIYEYLIKQFAASAGKKGGEFYTPHEVSLLMAKIVTYGKKVENEAFSVFDPACGSGSLLLTVGTCLEGADRIGSIRYYGQELNTGTYNIARMNLMLHDVPYQSIHLNNADTLGRDWPDGLDDKGVDHPRMFDAVVQNPPYSQNWSSDESYLKDPRYKDYGKLAPKSKADFAFLQNGLYHLDPNNGVMAIVLPHGVLFRGAAEEAIRKRLIEKNNIDTIIGLPANLFYGTSIPTIIMILKKNQKKDRNILFIDASKEFGKVKNQNVLREEDIEKIFKTYKERKDVEKYAHLASMEEIIENDYNLNIPRYVDTSEEEEEIDLDDILAKIDKDDEEIEKLQSEINDQLRILGVLK